MFEQKSILRPILLYVIAILFVIMNISSIKIAGIANVVPLFDLMLVFYFATLRREFALWFIFLLGMWNDALNGTPLGATALCYIVLIKLFLMMNNKMIMRESFIQVWRQFVAFSFLFLLFKWLLVSLFNDHMQSLTTPLVQLILSSSVYVPMHKFFDYLSHKLLDDE
jgi:rod shape-determining protein MreD